MVKNTILFAGDSLTYGSGNTGRIPLPIFVMQEASKYGIDLVPLTVCYPGWTSADLYRALCGFTSEVKEAVVYVGTNDAKLHVPPDMFIMCLKAIGNIIEHNCKALRVFYAIPPLLSGFGSQGYDVTVNRFLEEYAIRMRSEFDAVFEVEGVVRPDGVHPGDDGYALVAKKMWEEISRWRTWT